MRSPLPLAALAVTAAVGALASSAAAATGSAVVYVQDGDVWQVQPDGRNAKAITTDGTKDAPYARPRQAPDGSVWALKDFDVVHLGASGQKLASFKAGPFLDSKGVASDETPESLDLSPDGTKLAVGVDNIRCEDAPSDYCNFDGITVLHDTAGKKLTQDTRMADATFLDDDRLVGNDGQWESEVRIWSTSAASALWYTDGVDLHAGELGTTREPAFAPDLTHFAAQRTITNYGNYVYTYKVAAGSGPGGFGTPQSLCSIDRVVSTGGSPSWSPDGKRLVVAQTDGLVAYDLSQVTTGAECATKSSFLQLGPAGATQADWGTVPVPDPPVPTPTTTTTTTATTPTTTTTSLPTTTTQQPPVDPVTKPAIKAAVTVPAQRLRVIVKKGLKLKLTGVPAGRAKVVVKAKGRVVGQATVTVPSSGTLEATVKLTKAGARALAKAKSASLTISAGPVTKSVKVKA